MKIKFRLYLSLIAIIIFSIPVFVNAQVFIDAESGVVFTGYNNVRIPGDTGTKFSLKDDLTAGPNVFIRLKAGITIGSRHTISVLYAPLKVRSEGVSDMEIDFNGIRFPASTQLDATYKFNSYRITYRYDIVKRPKFEFGLGFTAKIRDAEIALSSPGMSSSKTNVGFVPIIHFRLSWKMNERIGIVLDGDALAAPQGRAEDVLVAGTYKFSDHFLFRLGYRILEGGADNDEVYNFALIHYASTGLTYTF